MPASVDYFLYISMESLPVFMALCMNSRHIIAASLTKEEIHGLKNRLDPDIFVNRKWSGFKFSDSDVIYSFFPEIRKVEFMKFPVFVFESMHITRKSYIIFLVNHLKSTFCTNSCQSYFCVSRPVSD